MSAEEFFSEQLADRRHGRPVQPQQWIVRVELDGVATVSRPNGEGDRDAAILTGEYARADERRHDLPAIVGGAQ